MSLLDYALGLTTLAAFALGLSVKRSWRRKLGFCALVAIGGWGLRALVIFNGDVTAAEDYFNGLTLRTGALEIAIALGWVGSWCALGTIAVWTMHKRNSKAH